MGGRHPARVSVPTANPRRPRRRPWRRGQSQSAWTVAALRVCNHATQTITVRTGLAPAQQTKTLAHEIAHALLHGSAFDGPRAQAELEAESVAYIVMSTLKIDSAAYSFGYLASWGAEPDAIRRSGQRIQQTAQTLIGALGIDDETAFPSGGVTSSHRWST